MNIYCPFCNSTCGQFEIMTPFGADKFLCPDGLVGGANHQFTYNISDESFLLTVFTEDSKLTKDMDHIMIIGPTRIYNKGKWYEDVSVKYQDAYMYLLNFIERIDALKAFS